MFRGSGLGLPPAPFGGGVYGGLAPMPLLFMLNFHKVFCADAQTFELKCKKEIPKTDLTAPILRRIADLAPTKKNLYLCRRCEVYPFLTGAYETRCWRFQRN